MSDMIKSGDIAVPVLFKGAHDTMLQNVLYEEK